MTDSPSVDLSPDGRWLAHHDKDQQLWLYDTRAKQDKRIAQSMAGNFSDLSWSPDSRWLAYVEIAANMFSQIKLWNIEAGASEVFAGTRTEEARDLLRQEFPERVTPIQLDVTSDCDMDSIAGVDRGGITQRRR